ncbi:MAG: DNA translocase FtsK [Rhizobiaceae bacterium]
MQAPDVNITSQSVALDRARYGVTRDSELGKTRSKVLSFNSLIPTKLRAPLNKVSGFILSGLSFVGALALATWSVSDPSLTFANGRTADNWLGFWGASFADFIMQFLGFASVIFLAPLLIWGLLKITNRDLGFFRHRFSYWMGSLVVGAAALGCLKIPTGWPLEVGLGGVVGDAVLSIPRAFIGSYPSGFFAVILFFILAAPAVWLLLRACGLQNGIPTSDRIELNEAQFDQSGVDDDLSLTETEVEGRDWSGLFAMPIGLIIHWVYSVKTYFRNRQQAPQQMIKRQVGEMASASSPSANTFVDEPLHDSEFEELDEANTGDDDQYGHQVLERTRIDAPALDDEPVPHTDAAQPVEPAPRAAKRIKAKKANAKFTFPSLELLSDQKSLIEDPTLSTEALEENARRLEGVLDDFGVKGQILKVRPGPVVTLYELEPAPGVKSSRVIGLAEDIARSMSAIAARVAVVPGRNAIGIELPNKRRETVYLREQLSTKEFKNSKAKLPMCLGKTIGGEPVVVDLAKMPHLLMAGTTGSGKSVGINTMILSLLYRLGPDKCKMIMIDPKMLELSIYDGIPHLLTPVVVDPKKAVVALKWTVREMEERYKKMSKVGVRNIDGFNARVAEAAAKGEVITRTVQTGFDRHTGEAIYEHEELDLEALPFIVVVIDEMADLMMVAGKDIEGTVQRLAQMARAAGIHVIMATQRPSVDVITGTIKANFPTRISFQVTSKIDSRTILGEMGAEQLLGMGDMLYMAGGGRITRVHGPFVSDSEVEDIVNHLKSQGVPQYLEAVTEEDEEDGGAEAGQASGELANSDDPYDQAVAIVLRDRKASTSYIQRRLSIGYNRAASLVERMEQEGLISPANHAGKREILVPAEDEIM